MAPIDRPVPRFAAEPPQDDLPAGPWEGRLREVFLAACDRIDTDGHRPRRARRAALVPRPDLERAHLPPRHRADEHGPGALRPRLVPAPGGGRRGRRGLRRDGRLHRRDRRAPPRVEDRPLRRRRRGVERRGRGPRGHDARVGRADGARRRGRDGGAGGEVVDGCVLEENRFTLLAPDGIGGSLEIAVADDLGLRDRSRAAVRPVDDGRRGRGRLDVRLARRRQRRRREVPRPRAAVDDPAHVARDEQLPLVPPPRRARARSRRRRVRCRPTPGPAARRAGCRSRAS